VEIMRLKTENEALRRADKKEQAIRREGAGAAEDSDDEDSGATVSALAAAALDAAGPALTSALARFRARRATAQGVGPKP
jgi:hypothetical protein